MTAAAPDESTRRTWLGRRGRQTLLTAHIIVSVGLLGDSAGFLAVAIRHAVSDDPVFREHARQLLAMFALGFGIPLSFLSLVTGVALGLGTRWGVFRYGWVIAKLVLIVTVILVGAVVLRPSLFGTSANDTALIAGAAWDVTALVVATTLSVFKPGRPLRE